MSAQVIIVKKWNCSIFGGPVITFQSFGWMTLSKWEDWRRNQMFVLFCPFYFKDEVLYKIGSLSITEAQQLISS